jgi:hypothetical protein
MMTAELYKEIKESLEDNFRLRDMITGRKKFSILNKKEVSNIELDQVMNSWLYERTDEGEV